MSLCGRSHLFMEVTRQGLEVPGRGPSGSPQAFLLGAASPLLQDSLTLRSITRSSRAGERGPHDHRGVSQELPDVHQNPEQCRMSG